MFFSSPLLSFFFLLLLRPPPRSPLFPYTTLFRSKLPFHVFIFYFAVTSGFFVSLIVDQFPQRTQFRIDRKSTCLNSSHVAISYAVFCLKKKKKESSIVMYVSADFAREIYC